MGENFINIKGTKMREKGTRSVLRQKVRNR